MAWPTNNDQRFDQQNVTGPFLHTFKATEAIVDGVAVEMVPGSDNSVRLSTGTIPAIGVSDQAIASGDEGTIQTYGPLKWMIAAAQITAGDELKKTTGGKVTPKAGADEQRVGIAINSVTNANELVSVMLLPGLTLA